MTSRFSTSNGANNVSRYEYEHLCLLVKLHQKGTTAVLRSELMSDTILAMALRHGERTGILRSSTDREQRDPILRWNWLKDPSEILTEMREQERPKTFVISWSKVYTRSGTAEIQARSMEEAAQLANERIGDWEGSLQYHPTENEIIVEKKQEDTDG